MGIPKQRFEVGGIYKVTKINSLVLDDELPIGTIFRVESATLLREEDGATNAFPDVDDGSYDPGASLEDLLDHADDFLDPNHDWSMKRVMFYSVIYLEYDEIHEGGIYDEDYYESAGYVIEAIPANGLEAIAFTAAINALDYQTEQRG